MPTGQNQPVLYKGNPERTGTEARAAGTAKKRLMKNVLQ